MELAHSLICKPEFGDLCVQHARQTDACFVVARYVIKNAYMGSFDEKHGWSFLDLNARRWYTIRQDKQEVFDCFVENKSVAMDGGLVCQHLQLGDNLDISISVSNPIVKTFRLLPSSSYYCTSSTTGSDWRVNMVVDNIAHNYKIFVMPSGDNGELISAVNPLVAVFESKTNQWRSSINLPMALVGLCIDVQCSVFFHGILFLFIRPTDIGPFAAEYWLWSYNDVEDTWKDTGVNIPFDHELFDPQLVVSDNRLFLESWVPALSEIHRGRPIDYVSSWSTYEISEVNLVDRTRTTVFR